ncbi:MAG TPA: hypothetical protein VI759_10635 [Dehalococcoidia bacterium]|nr:hypothetical protein [Dehalococcoidia bacterium]
MLLIVGVGLVASNSSSSSKRTQPDTAISACAEAGSCATPTATPTPEPEPELTPEPVETAEVSAGEPSPEPAALPNPGDFSPFPFDLYEDLRLVMPAQVDSNSPAVWIDGTLVMFNSAKGTTVRTSGDSVANLYEPMAVQLPLLPRPGYVWIESVWRDESDGVLYGWYHFEPADLDCYTAPIIGAAVSYDAGLTWEDRGFVIDSPYPVDCDYTNGYVAGGNGDFDVILDTAGQYFYFLFSNYAGPIDQQGVNIARSPFASRGQPGSVTKYFGWAWSEPGIGGQATAIFPSSTGWKGPYIEAYWGPSVHWNTYLNRYVALLNHTAGENYVQEGIYITFSEDLLNWTAPVKLIDGGGWYAEALGLEAGDTDTIAGQSLRIYVSGVSDYVLVFR